MVSFSRMNFWTAFLLLLHFYISDGLYFVPASLVGSGTGVITAAQALGIIGATGLVGAAGVAILTGKVLLHGKKKYYDSYGYGYSNSGGYSSGGYSSAPYTSGAYGGPGYVGGFGYRSDDGISKEHSILKRSIKPKTLVTLPQLLQESYYNEIGFTSDTEAVMERLMEEVVLRDVFGCGSRLVCELLQKPVHQLSPEEKVIVKFFRKRFTMPFTSRITNSQLYHAALLGLSSSDEFSTCSKMFHRCPTDSTVQRNEFIEAARMYQKFH